MGSLHREEKKSQKLTSPYAYLCFAIAFSLHHLSSAYTGSPGSISGTWSVNSSTINVSVSIALYGATSITSFSLFASDNWTINLAANGLAPSDSSTSTLLDLDGTMWSATANSNTVVTSNGTDLTIINLFLGPPSLPYAMESWHIRLTPATGPLQGITWQWSINRTWLRTSFFASDRMALTLTMTGAPPIHGYQIPGFIDPRMFMNGSAGFPLFATSNPELNPIQFYEFLSPTTEQLLVFTPVYARIWTAATLSSTENTSLPIFWSFAKPFADGTAVHVTLGSQFVDRRSGGLKQQRGSTSLRTWSLTMLEGTAPVESFPSLNLTLPPTWVNLSIASDLFAHVHSQFMGWVFGNNPASVPCLQEMAFFAWIQAIFPASNIQHGVAAVQNEISFFSRCGWDGGNGESQCQVGSGLLMQRWASSGFYNAPWGPMNDQTPNFILAVHSLAVTTGDKEWLALQLPAVEAVAEYMLANGMAETGIFTMPEASGLADGGKHCTNWFDIIEFGHYDAYNNALAILALEAAVDMHTFMGNISRAAYYEKARIKSIGAFNAIFWQDSLQRYSDWIDIENNARSYGYVDIDFLAIIGGAANASQAASFITLLNSRYVDLAVEYNLSDDAIWSVPCSLFKMTNPLDAAIPQNTPPSFPSYEAGGSFFREVGYEALARALSGDAAGAHRTYDRFMALGFAQNRAWAQQLYWNTGELVGGDPLNNALMALWGWLRGVFGVKPMLQGLVATNKPAAELEGARWTFAFLGYDYCVVIQTGVTRECVSGRPI